MATPGQVDVRIGLDVGKEEHFADVLDGAGPLGNLGPLRTGGQIGDACFAYGSAPGRQSVTISFEGRRHDVPVSQHGVWAFIKVRTDPTATDPLP